MCDLGVFSVSACWQPHAIFPLIFVQDTSVSSSDIPGAKTGFTDLFKSKSNTTVVVPESLVTSSSTRSPRIAIRSSPKKAHAAAPIASLGTSSQASWHEEDTMDDYQIIDRIVSSADSEKMPVSTDTLHTSLTQSSHSHQTRLEDSHREQGSQGASRRLDIGHPSSSDLSIESRVQISTGDPDNPLVFGVIRWIGELTNGGRTAGLEMVNQACCYMYRCIPIDDSHTISFFICQLLLVLYVYTYMQDKSSEGYSDGTLASTGQKFFSCSPGHGFYCPVAELQPDTGSREYCRFRDYAYM